MAPQILHFPVTAPGPHGDPFHRLTHPTPSQKSAARNPRLLPSLEYGGSWGPSCALTDATLPQPGPEPHLADRVRGLWGCLAQKELGARLHISIAEDDPQCLSGPPKSRVLGL